MNIDKLNARLTSTDGDYYDWRVFWHVVAQLDTGSTRHKRTRWKTVSHRWWKGKFCSFLYSIWWRGNIGRMFFCWRWIKSTVAMGWSRVQKLFEDGLNVSQASQLEFKEWNKWPKTESQQVERIKRLISTCPYLLKKYLLFDGRWWCLYIKSGNKSTKIILKITLKRKWRRLNYVDADDGDDDERNGGKKIK